MKFNRKILKDIRLNKNLTQTKLAEISQVRRVYITKYEQGVQPRYDNLTKICKALDIKPEDLYI